MTEHPAVGKALELAAAVRDEEAVIEGELVAYGPMPTRKALILRGRAALAQTGRNPDDYVDPATEQALRDATPQNTRAVLEWGWGRWLWWTGQPDIGVPHLPARPAGLRRYVQAHKTMTHQDGRLRGRYGQPYAPQTVELAVYAVVMVHQRLGYPSPMEDKRVRAQLREYSAWWEAQGFRPDESYPLTSDEAVEVARTQDLATVNGLRNALAFRLLMDMGCRPDELLHIQMGDVSWETPDRVVIRISRSKTDQAGKGRVVGVEAGRVIDEAGNPVVDDDGQPVRLADWDVDPVRLLGLQWEVLTAAGFRTGPLLRAVYPAPRRNDGAIAGTVRDEAWTYEGLDMAFRRAVKQSGVNLDPRTGERRHVTLYSFRCGMITRAEEAGVPLQRVGRRTGHNLGSYSLTRYFRSGRQWGDDNPGLAIRQAADRARALKTRKGKRGS